MDESRRRAYLDAMGVTIWESRRPPAVTRSGPADPDGTPGPKVEPIPEPSPPPVAVRSPSQDAPSPPALAEPPAPALGPVAGESATSMDWDALGEAVASCRRCGLWESRTRTVFGVGNRGARLMIIGEAPGADEDRAGEPFVGRAGQLLNRMLTAIGFQRDQVYIANVLKCRPPGNRDPRPEEALQCQGYLLRQVELIAPRLILAVGRIAAQNLLQTDVSVGRLRGRWFAFGPGDVPLRVTYHPAYLLRSPEQKAKAWEDLVEVRRRLDRHDGRDK